MRIGELARRTGASVRMLRYYEGQGLLQPTRTPAGYRDYDATDEETVLQIKTLGAAGMTLAVIRDFLPCALDTRGRFEPCDELRATVRRQIERVDQRVADLNESRAMLEAILKRLSSSRP